MPNAVALMVADAPGVAAAGPTTRNLDHYRPLDACGIHDGRAALAHWIEGETTSGLSLSSLRWRTDVIRSHQDAQRFRPLLDDGVAPSWWVDATNPPAHPSAGRKVQVGGTREFRHGPGGRDESMSRHNEFPGATSHACKHKSAGADHRQR